jgi:hypothetical protein
MPNFRTALTTDKDQIRMFLADLNGANKAFVRISSPSASGSADFVVANGREAITEFLSECPMPASPAPGSPKPEPRR